MFRSKGLFPGLLIGVITAILVTDGDWTWYRVVAVLVGALLGAVFSVAIWRWMRSEGLEDTPTG